MTHDQKAPEPQIPNDPILYTCPKHGEVVETVFCEMPDMKHRWCLRCIFEQLITLGVNEVTDPEEKQDDGESTK